MIDAKTGLIRRNSNLLPIALFLLLVFAVLFGMAFLYHTKAIGLPIAEGYCDLSGRDLADTVYHIDGPWESYPEELYAPGDFAGGIAGAPRFLAGRDYKDIPYATHRLRLALPQGPAVYGISMKSSDYAMRLYIDGREIDSVGAPGTTRESTEPRVLERTYYFTPQAGEAEIVVQAANFVHAKGGALPPDLYIGTAGNITGFDDANLAVSYLVIGCLMCAFLYHIGLFCLNRKRKTVLVFALCCLLLALLNKKLVLMLWPGYDWYVGIRIEYLLHFLAFALLVFLVDRLHPKLLHKWATRGYYAVAGAYILTLCLDSLVFTGLLAYFEAISLLIFAYLIIALALRLKGGGAKARLSFAGILALGLLGANDVLYYRGIEAIPPLAGQFFMTPIGMVFFVFCYALVLSVEYAETERAMQEAMEKEQALAAENAAIGRVNLLKTDLMRTVSHEMRTPLAVIMGFAEITAEDVRKSGSEDDTAANLDAIAAEAKRMADMMEEMRQLALAQEYQKDHSAVDAGAVIRQIAGLYARVLERSGTALELSVQEDLPPVRGNESELIQVLFNLLRNADVHTENGTIALAAKCEGGFVDVAVSDTGAGIPADLLPHVLERGVHGENGGTGFGLAVCKDIVDAYGGEIHIESEVGKGTRATFTLPVVQKGKDSE
ncbi:MAG: sensor histidine kinase [Clostridiales Family XIII bacterium]|nr:sensor histidine kinase [Clostridiales Family XIII bacterium]